MGRKLRVCVIALVILITLVTGCAQSAPTPPSADSSTTQVVYSLPVYGKLSTTPVMIQEYMDFLCPECRQYVLDVEPQIEKEYIDTGKLSITFYPMTGLGQDSFTAAKAYLCVNKNSSPRDGKFWEYRRTLFQNANVKDAFTKDKLKIYAADRGLDTAKFNQCLDNGDTEKDVKAIMSDSKNRGISTTKPSFHIYYVADQVFQSDSINMEGTQPFAIFRAQIEKQLTAQRAATPNQTSTSPNTSIRTPTPNIISSVTIKEEPHGAIPSDQVPKPAAKPTEKPFIRLAPPEMTAQEKTKEAPRPTSSGSGSLTPSNIHQVLGGIWRLTNESQYCTPDNNGFFDEMEFVNGRVLVANSLGIPITYSYIDGSRFSIGMANFEVIMNYENDRISVTRPPKTILYAGPEHLRPTPVPPAVCVYRK